VGPVDIKKLIKTNISFFECGNIAIDNVYEEILNRCILLSFRLHVNIMIHRGNCSGKKATRDEISKKC